MKMGEFPHSTGARQDGRISTRQRRPARWADSHTTAAPGKMGGFPYRHVCSLCYPWIVQLSGSLVVWRSVPRNRPRAAANAQYGAATRRLAAVPARRRAAPTAHPRGGRAAAAWRRAGLWLSREGGWPVAPVSPAVSGDLRPVSGGVRRGRLPCPDGHKNR